MAGLLNIDRERLAHAATLETDRQLVRYICGPLAPLLPRLPTQPERIAPFVQRAGPEAIAAGFADGGLYGWHILTDLLLGRNWERSPFHADRRFESILDAPGLRQEVRIVLAMNAVIDARQALEEALPGMIDAALVPLSLHPEVLTPKDTWLAFEQIASLRGLRWFEIESLFETYEAGFRKAHGLPPIERRKLSGYDRMGYESMGIPLPLPYDDIQFSPFQTVCFNAALLLELLYGPSRHENPLLEDLTRLAADTSHLGVLQYQLKQFLLSHRKALTEDLNG
ncbi:hypothetical protein [Pseudomonas aeruginosa]|uniref:hypothetical protein n=1 Tax=Pseudomonas aeruginosa TaxID=287 RepID=UPI0015C54588|nr:hypothetical protein [Pseudomonas aeruginosa]NPW33428.1 hypothetical protein [Pseudomonas aeruginosa]